ncbi:methionine adenosyltransferase [Parvularcula sp. ZS-1/3]|uniref:Methionine adenosyltransferase n=1 Tax=Parvularcula mediterranea TaxID=2732508 RepID=A0A7Y3RKD0_9PROT|nr:methionine adenosyltransferase [Parvularcula mediterranea]
MTRQDYIFTSESVSEGHPDKVSDRISDAIVDLHLSKQPEARVAVETLTTTNRVVLAGETRCEPGVSAEEMIETARGAIKAIGYEQDGFHWKDASIECHVHGQSTEIAMGVDAGDDKDEGAGDQGIMFGFATDETESLMPAPIAFSHAIVGALADARHKGSEDRLLPDAKSQVTVKYEGGRPVGTTSVVVSTQHVAGLSQADVREMVRPYIEKCLPEGWMPPEDELYVNPTGQFVIGGPDGDAGLTGRKIIVDTYGGAAPHGGGAFSGKDPTKVDRSAAYACRYLAKNVVAAGLARRCVLQVSYAIGVAKPLSLYVDFQGTGEVGEAELESKLLDIMDLSPRGIRTHLGLNKPIYERTAAYGHFGREPDADGGFSWEKTDLVDELKRAF